MGKVKDGGPVSSTPAKASKAANPGNPSGKKGGGGFGAFLVNLASAGRYKPLQGRRARLMTVIGLGVVVAFGMFALYNTLAGQPRMTRLAVPVITGVVLAWLVYRMVEFPPFVEFLIATEAEMNKVSWTSRDELKRATAVVLVVVTMMALFLFGVDFIWQLLLKGIGVLRFSNTGDMGADG